MILNSLLFGVALYSELASSTVVAYSGRPRIDQTYFVIDPQLGWRLQPGLTVDLLDRFGQHRVPFFTAGELGTRIVRDEDPSRAADILVLGDSFVQGYYLFDYETIPARLEDLTGQTTLNAGIGGYSTDQQYLLLRRLLNQQSPDYVVVVAFSNDLPTLDHETAWGLPKPRFDVHDDVVDTSSVRLPPFAGHLKWALDSRNFAECCMPGGYNSLLEKLGRSYAALLSPAQLLPELRSQIRVTKPPQPEYQIASLDFYSHPEVYRSEWGIFFQLLLHMQAESQRKGSQFLVLFLPELAQVVQPNLDHFAPQRFFSDHCSELGLDCIEPHEAFIENQQSADLFFMDDGHLSPQGADLAAKIIADHVTAPPR